MSPSGDGLLADLFLGRPRSRSYPKFNIRRDIPLPAIRQARLVLSPLLPTRLRASVPSADLRFLSGLLLRFGRYSNPRETEASGGLRRRLLRWHRRRLRWSVPKALPCPGEHAVELRLEGHRTFRRRILATPSHTQKIRHEMVPLGPRETEPPVESGAAESPEPQDRGARPASPPEPRQPPPPPPSTAPAPPTSSVPRSTSLVRFGVLTLRVQPAEAQVRIDGEVWGHLGGMEELSIHLPAGTHWIELLRDGQPAFSTEVEIQLGQTTPLNIRLAP